MGSRLAESLCRMWPKPIFKQTRHTPQRDSVSPHGEDQWFCSHCIANTARDIVGAEDIRLKLRLDQRTPSPPREIEYNLLRVMAEAISNSVKHSGARNIGRGREIQRVESLRLYGDRDDGIGFGEQQTQRSGPGHYGLIGMEERARQIGAKFELRKVAGLAVTTAVLSLPHWLATGRETWPREND